MQPWWQVGIGFSSVSLEDVQMVIPQKVLAKKCKFCSKGPGDEDTVNAGWSMSWGKPDWGGTCCGTCGAAKSRLYPTLDQKEVLAKINSEPEERTKFTEFCQWLVTQYKSGNRRVRDQLQAFEQRPRQEVARTTKVSVSTEDEGVMKLYETYKEKYGSPSKNGKGHLRTMAEWKDGTIRDVVLMPERGDDELKCVWRREQGVQHKTVLDDGQLTKDKDQQMALYKSLASKAKRGFQGQAVPSHQLPAALPDMSKPSSSGKKPGPSAPTAGAPANANEDESDESECEATAGGCDLLSLMTPSSKGTPASSPHSSSMDRSGGKPARAVRAAAKPAAKAKAKADPAMPAPLRGGGASAGSGGRRSGASAAAAVPGPADATAKMEKPTPRHVRSSIIDRHFLPSLESVR